MHAILKEWLACPACHGRLAWAISLETADRILEAIASCRDCSAEYPVREGIGLFLTPDLPRNDLWEKNEQRFSQVLGQNEALYRRLMEAPLASLGAADAFFRGMVHEEQAEWEQARQAFDHALPNLYTNQYRNAWNAQMEWVVDALAEASEPIVDLASGRCYLVERLARDVTAPIVATDFSPRVLRRNRAWLAHQGLDSRVSLLAFDARRTPFRDRSLPTLTTNLGIPNIENPGGLMCELRRIVHGRFLAISHFFSPTDCANLGVLLTFGLEKTMLRDHVLADWHQAGWTVDVQNALCARAEPTPKGVVLAEQGIDALPVAETELEWCVLEAS